MDIHSYVKEAEELATLSLFVKPKTKEAKDFLKRYEELARAAMEHKKDFEPINTSDRTLWAVHPLCYKNEQPPQIRGLMDGLRTGPYTRVLASDAILYVLMEHKLVEDGLVDHLVITTQGYGFLLHTENLYPFRNSRRNIVGGCYLDCCVSTFANSLRENGFRRVKLARELSYKKPVEDEETFAPGTLG